MKKSLKKLTLHRETIGSLTDDRLSQAAGGGKSQAASFCATCGSCACPSQIETDCCQNTNLGCVESYINC